MNDDYPTGSNGHGTDTLDFGSKSDLHGKKGNNGTNGHVKVDQVSDGDLLNTLLGSAEDKIYFKNIESRFLRCSASMAQQFNVPTAADLIGKCDRDFFSDEHALAAFEDEQKIIHTGEPLGAKIEKETYPDGRVTWALTVKKPMRNGHGQIIGTFGISKDITALREAETKLDDTRRQLLETSRQAGMAEVATSVLHNVGNVLNSVNVSTSVIADKIRKSKVSSVSKVVSLLKTHENNLAEFFTTDPKGKQLLEYISQLSTHLTQEQEETLQEIRALGNNVMHIKEIVCRQQNYAKTFGVKETLSVIELVEDALQLNCGAMDRHNIKMVREFTEVPPIVTEKHKVLQILVNLLRNAKYACDDSGREDKQIILRLAAGDGCVRISVTDNGIGISPDNLTRIFGHGFTTRKEGHGFGLHNGANNAREMGGKLTAFSEGIGHGATFTLELPVNTKK